MRTRLWWAQADPGKHRNLNIEGGGGWLVGRWAENAGCQGYTFEFTSDGRYLDSGREMGTWRLGGNRLIIYRKETTTESAVYPEGNRRIVFNDKALTRC